MKESLLKQELIIDADDRKELTTELEKLGLNYTINGHITVPYRESAQEIIRQLKTKLKILRIDQPTLEDAYIEFLNKAKEADK